MITRPTAEDENPGWIAPARTCQEEIPILPARSHPRLLGCSLAVAWMLAASHVAASAKMPEESRATERPREASPDPGQSEASSEPGVSRTEIEALKERIRELEAAAHEAPESLVTTKPAAAEETISEEDLRLELGGALRFNYAYRDFTETSRSKGGDVEFEIFRLDAEAEYRNLIFSAQYRWYEFQDVIHHGWVGARFGEGLEARVGVTQVPFGLLPYASQSWWFGVPYYLGFEDDYDLGGSLLFRDEGWDVRLAFFKNGEYGNASRKERYSFDLVSDSARGQGNEETNQVDLRVARLFEIRPDLHAELGLSGEWGQIHNEITDDTGSRWAAGAHLDGRYRHWKLQLEAFLFEFDPRNPVGVSEESILLGAFGSTFLSPAEGTVLVANLARSFPVDLGPLTGITCYNNYSILLPDDGDLEEVQINTTGCLLNAGPLATYIDVIAGSGAPFLGVPPEDVFTPIADDDWKVRFNVNLGFYF